MIVSLTIKNIVLIDRLQIDFEGGLCVLSGETGAGKSILLSGIGLVIGARSEKEQEIRNNEQKKNAKKLGKPMDLARKTD